MVSKSDFKSNDLSWFLGGVNMNLLFDSGIVNLMLKPKGGRGGGGGQKLNFVFFVVWSALSVARWYWCEADSLV